MNRLAVIDKKKGINQCFLMIKDIYSFMEQFIIFDLKILIKD